MRREYRTNLIRLVTVFLVACAGIAAAGEEEDPKIKGKTVSRLLKQLNNKNVGLQARAARTLSAAPKELRPKLIPKLIPLLQAERKDLRCWVAQVLGNYGTDALVAVPALVPLLKGTQFERNRSAAAKALGQILENAEPSPQIEEVAKALATKFNEEYDTYGDVRREAVHAIGMIGPAAKIAIPKFTRGLTDTAPTHVTVNECRLVRQQSAWACGRMGPLAKEHLSRLISMMHQEGTHLPEIAWAIGEIGAIHENVVPNIMDAIEKGWNLNKYPGFVFNGIEALEKFGPKSAGAVDFLVARLGTASLNGKLATQILETLGAIGPKAKKALELIRKFKDTTSFKEYRLRGLSDEDKAAIVKAAEAAEKAITATGE